MATPMWMGIMPSFEGLDRTKRQRVNFLCLPDCVSWDMSLLPFFPETGNYTRESHGSRTSDSDWNYPTSFPGTPAFLGHQLAGGRLWDFLHNSASITT